MSKKTPKHKVLSEGERYNICFLLNEGKTFSEIARTLNRSVSTITREIDGHTVKYKSKKNNCKSYFARTCERKGICDRDCNRRYLCRKCSIGKCWTYCKDYDEKTCDKLLEPPYVCNGCTKNNTNCRYSRVIYDPKIAHEKAVDVRKTKSAGYDYTDEQIEIINALISPQIENGASPFAALVAKKDELARHNISLSKNTLYRMVARNDLDSINLSLPEKVRRRPKTKRRNHELQTISVQKAGHLWEDYLGYMSEHDVVVPQMDCVEGKKTDRAALLTLYWGDSHIQTAIILDRHDSIHVVEALDVIERCIGFELFRKMLPAILTDNGQEFTDIQGMQRSCTIPGEERTYIYFCEPNRSDQKGGCERNHREMRRIIPKGTSLEPFIQSDIVHIMNNINNYPRESLRGKSPYDMAEMLGYPEGFLTGLGMERIPCDEICMNSHLLIALLQSRRGRSDIPV